jgi:hypothetical protein
VGRIERRRLDEAGWRDLLARFPASGLSVAAFCEREGLIKSTFYRWRALLKPASPAMVVGSAPNTTAGSDVAQARFVDLGVLAASAQAARLEVTLDLGGGVLLHIVRR